MRKFKPTSHNPLPQLDSSLNQAVQTLYLLAKRINTVNNMDLIAIERESFDAFRKKLRQLVSLVPKQSSSNILSIEQEWIEGKELAASLNITLRRLQYLRESGKLSFSTLGKKTYYRISEVKSLLEQSSINAKQ